MCIWQSKKKKFEEAKQEIIEKIKVSEIKNVNRLLNEVGEHFKTNKQPNVGVLVLILSIAIILSFILSVFPPFWKAGEKLNFEILFVILAFVVALAAYVASVVRQIVEKLPKVKNTKPDRWKELKCNMFLLVSAEMLMLAFGLFAIIRIFTGPLEISLQCYNLCLSLDSFLLAFLAIILLYLSGLHILVWYQIKPWDFNIND
jgi:hypothetical protein